MSKKFINSHNANCLETLDIELYNISYTFDMFINSDDFYSLPYDENMRERVAACQKCISDTPDRLKAFEEKFKRYIECVNEEI